MLSHSLNASLSPRRTDDDEETATLVETKKALTRKSIEQLGYIKDINSLIVLSGVQCFC